jgi:DNA polymerase-3 subunit epsilon
MERQGGRGVDSKELIEARKAAIEANQCFSKGRLRDEFKMKPKPDAQPVKFYKNVYGRRFGVYRIADCVPSRQGQMREPSLAQVAAAKRLGIMAKLRSSLAVAGAKACAWLDAGALFLDTETTGLGHQAQIVEIAICDASGAVLLESRVKPTVPIEEGAAAVHGIEAAALADAPRWGDISHRVKAILAGRELATFNAEFDRRIIRQTSAAFGECCAWLDTVTIRCAMHLAAEAYGATNRYGTISLAEATLKAGVTWTGAAHGAAADARATVDLVTAIADHHRDLKRQLAALPVTENAAPCRSGIHGYLRATKLPEGEGRGQS